MASLSRPLRLGTRASPLAMAQAHLVRDALIAAHGWAAGAIEICPQVASGDRILDRALADLGGKALWTKELDASLGEGHIDFAVHSMKDVETLRPESLRLAAMLPRADVRDRLIGAASIEAIPRGARFGTSAPRRRAQMLRLRPDLEIILFRGNVQTRLAKLAAGEAAATLLAAAGLERLGLTDTGVAVPVETLLPAPSQGAIGIEARAADAEVNDWLAAINHAPTHRCVAAERLLLAHLAGDCRSPVAAHASEADGAIRLDAILYAPDGSACVEGSVIVTNPDSPAQLARQLLATAPLSILAVFGR